MPQKIADKLIECLIEAASYIAIILICIAAYLMLSYTELNELREEQRQDLFATRSEIAAKIQQSFSNKQLIARSVSAALTINPDITQDEFYAFGEAINVEDPSIDTIAIVRGTIVTRVYSTVSMKNLLGRDLAERPNQLPDLEKVRQEGRTRLSGPTWLLREYPGFVMRQPVSTQSADRDNSENIDIVSLVFSLEAFLNELGLNKFSERYNIVLSVESETQPQQAIYGDLTTLDDAQAVSTLPILGMVWKLALMPRETLSLIPSRESRIVPLLLIGGVLAMMLTRYLHVLRRRNRRAAHHIKTALDTAPSGFVLFDANDRIELFNDRFVELLGDAAPSVHRGASRESLLRATLRHNLFMVPIEDEEGWIKEQMKHLTVRGERNTAAMSDGTWLQILEHTTSSGGRVMILNDVTETLQSRERAKVAEQRLNDAIDALPVGFWLFDATDRLILFNTVAREKFEGVKRDLALGRPIGDLVQRRVEIAELVLVNGKPVNDYKLITKTLQEETSEIEARYSEGRWFRYYTRRTSEGGLVMFRVEITDLREQQRQIEASNTELRAALRKRDEAEQRLQAVADMTSEWYWEQDTEMRLVHISEGFARAMEVDPKDYIGKTRYEIFGTLPKTAETPFGEMVQKMIAHEPFRDIIFSHNFEPNKTKWVRMSGKPLYTPEGLFTGYIGMAADVTPLYEALREAKQADEAKTQFLNMISHELRTPLTAVLGFNSFLANHSKLPSYNALREALPSGDEATIRAALEQFEKDLGQFTGRIQAAGTQLKALIDDMLDLARIEANNLRLNLGCVESAAVARSVVEQTQTLASEKGLEIKFDLICAPIYADETRFRQILTNLLGNAYKFTDEGLVEVRSSLQGDMVVFEVQDSGIGISKDMQNQVFDRFAQAKESTDRKNNGVGLGLAICKDLISAQNGWIKVKSEIGIGTTMSFALPLWKPKP